MFREPLQISMSRTEFFPVTNLFLFLHFLSQCMNIILNLLTQAQQSFSLLPSLMSPVLLNCWQFSQQSYCLSPLGLHMCSFYAGRCPLPSPLKSFQPVPPSPDFLNIFYLSFWSQHRHHFYQDTFIIEVKVAQSCPILCDPMDCIVHGILQARILERVAFPFFKRSPQPRDQTQVSRIAGGFFTS